MALGALLIQQTENLSDEHTVQHIRENMYMQYFVGLREFEKAAPFNPSSMTNFRKRITAEMMNEINEAIYLATNAKKKEQTENKSSNDNNDQANTDNNNDTNEKHNEKEPSNKGKLLLDATCAPADIRFPTDISLLNEAREKLDEMIDEVHGPLIGKHKHPRTYRREARKIALRFLKKRKPRKEDVRRTKRKLLGYVERNLRELNKLMEVEGAKELSQKQAAKLEVLRKLIQQQREMYDENKHSVENRIVSIQQPHVRPIVRGKARAAVEFGAKVEISLVDGYAFIDKINVGSNE